MAPSRRNPPPDGYKLSDTEPRFLIVQSMAREIISCEPLGTGIDQRSVIMATHERMAAEGWAVEGLAKYGPYFFAVKDGRRVEVRIGHDPVRADERMYRR